MEKQKRKNRGNRMNCDRCSTECRIEMGDCPSRDADSDDGECDNLAAEDGSGGYMLAYVSVMTPDGVPSFQLLVPEQETVPSDFRIRPVCSWGWSVPGGFGMDIKHDGNYYTALFRCLHSLGCGTEPNETRVLARFDSHGNLAAAPAILPLDDSSMCNDSNIALAFGEGTIGVFLVCPGKAYFQTLDEDGRYVGEPCDVSALVDHDSYLEVLGLAWDGEGYGVALIVDSDIRFYRFLPSS